MACRKDGKGRVLRKGEGYRKGDGRYSYVYVDPLGKKRTIYAKSLVKLREREEQLKKDQLDGLDVYVAGKADVNFLFDPPPNSINIVKFQKPLTLFHNCILRLRIIQANYLSFYQLLIADVIS